MKYSALIEEVKNFITESVDWLIKTDCGCCLYKLDDRIGIAVGWLNGYDENDNFVIHSKSEPTWAINVSLVVYTSDDMGTDLEFYNMPYWKNGDTYDTTNSVEPNEDYVRLAEWYLKEYEQLENWEFSKDGEILKDDTDDYSNNNNNND